MSLTESIVVFADLSDLPGQNETRRTLVGNATESKADVEGLYTTKYEDKHKTKMTNSICSFGFDQEVPETFTALAGSLEANSVERLAVDENAAQDINTPILGHQNRFSKDAQILYESFPRPPGKAVLQSPKTFVEHHQYKHKQPALSIDKTLPSPPYHVFDSDKKKRVLCIVIVVGILSPISSFIYFPAIAAISRGFDLSYQLVLLTITVHMAVHGISPLVWMPVGDYFGRRFTLLAGFAMFVGANIGLIFARDFLSLILLRSLQAFGSAHLTYLGAAVIGDISTGTEREKFLGIFGTILLLAYTTSPVFGGVFTWLFGFRAIFWFQSALGIIGMNLVLLFLPETKREIAGNGTIRLKALQQPLLAVIRSSPDSSFDSKPATVAFKFTLSSFVEPLSCLTHLSVLATIIFGSIAFATSVTVIATTALFLESEYHLSAILIGIAFIPSGAGSIIGFFLARYLFDRDFKITEKQYEAHQTFEDKLSPPKDNKNFPIERARLRSMWWVILLFIAATIGYGFSLSTRHIAIPLTFQFFTALGSTALLLLNSVLIIDLYPDNPASTTTIVNLVRFCTGAIAVGVTQLLCDKIGARFTFLSFAVILLLFTPVLVLQWMFGVKCRTKECTTYNTERFQSRFSAISWQTGFLVKVPLVSKLWGRFPRMAFTNSSHTWEKLRSQQKIRARMRISGLSTRFHTVFAKVSKWIHAWKEMRQTPKAGKCLPTVTS